MRRRHRMPFGAEWEPDSGARFRLWAPAATRVSLHLEGPGGAGERPLRSEPGGWFALSWPEARPGSRYRFVLPDGTRVPDPASRFQPEGVHGPSELIDPQAWSWSDGAWRGRPWEEAVLYELHVGAFAPEASYDGVRRRLDLLVELGVTALELMPLASTPGRWSWGYDGVDLFAPQARYGRPEALKALVDAAHARGLMVLLDVVYNHFGPEGNYLPLYAPSFFTPRHQTPWGDAIDFEGAPEVRRFFVENALYWLCEYHLDGLRLDAVHAIHDASRPDFLEELASEVRRRLEPERHVHLVLENDRNEARRLLRDRKGRPCFYTAQWNDDLHHCLHVALTGETDGYYEDYADDPLGRLARALAEGFAYQGEASRHRGGRPRGEPSAGLPPTAFVGFLQNHDQVGNRALGERLLALAPAEAVRAGLAVLLLAPAPPLLFMGEEWGAPSPFLFFCDFEPGLRDAVREGRRREFAGFPAFADPAARARIPDPGDAATWERSRLDWAGRETPEARGWLALYRRLLALRRRELVPRLAGAPAGAARGEHLDRGALHVRWRLGDGSLWSVLANLEPVERESPPRPAGRVVFALPEAPDGAQPWRRLPPWSVVWRIERA